MADVIPQQNGSQHCREAEHAGAGIILSPPFDGPRGPQASDGTRPSDSCKTCTSGAAAQNRGFSPARVFRPGNGLVVDPATADYVPVQVPVPITGPNGAPPSAQHKPQGH